MSQVPRDSNIRLSRYLLGSMFSPEGQRSDLYSESEWNGVAVAIGRVEIAVCGVAVVEIEVERAA